MGLKRSPRKQYGGLEPAYPVEVFTVVENLRQLEFRTFPDTLRLKAQRGCAVSIGLRTQDTTPHMKAMGHGIGILREVVLIRPSQQVRHRRYQEL